MHSISIYITFASAVIKDNVLKVYSPFEFYVSEHKPNLKYEIMHSTSGSHQEGRILAGRTTSAALRCGLFVQKTCQHEGYVRMLHSVKFKIYLFYLIFNVRFIFAHG